MNLQNLFMMIIHWFFSEATFVVKKHSGFPNVAMEKIPCAINLRKVHLPFAILVYQRIAIYQAICQMVRDIFRKSCIRYTWKTCEKKKKNTIKFPWPRPLPSMLEFRKWKRPAIALGRKEITQKRWWQVVM